MLYCRPAIPDAANDLLVFPFIIDQKTDLFGGRDCPDHLQPDLLDGLQLIGPGSEIVRPGEPGGPVRLPFRRQAIAEVARRAPFSAWITLCLRRLQGRSVEQMSGLSLHPKSAQ